METKSGDGVGVSGVGATFAAVAAVVFGVQRWLLGTVSTSFLVGCAMLAAGLVASQRTMWRHTRPLEAGAIANAGMFLLAGLGKLGGVHAGIGPLETAGEALFALAVVLFLVREDGA